MKKSIIIFGIILGVLFGSINVFALDKQDVSKSTVYLWGQTYDDQYLSCTGVVIKNSEAGSVILTANHCVEDTKKLLVEFHDAYTLARSDNYDLALVYTSNYLRYKTVAKISETSMKLNQQIFMLGILTTQDRWEKGRAVQYLPIFNLYALILEVQGGCSGGGIWNTNGELAGILVAALEIADKDTAISFAEPVDHILKFFDTFKYWMNY